MYMHYAYMNEFDLQPKDSINIYICITIEALKKCNVFTIPTIEVFIAYNIL